MNKFEYKNLTPFKWFVLENFPFIEADFDALTEWQLFCKLGKEMNKIINSENTLGTQMENVTNAFIELQNYVNNYFENLDVQDEINNKLDEMAQSGELDQIVGKYITSDIQPQINELNRKITENIQPQIDELNLKDTIMIGDSFIQMFPTDNWALSLKNKLGLSDNQVYIFGEGAAGMFNPGIAGHNFKELLESKASQIVNPSNIKTIICCGGTNDVNAQSKPQVKNYVETFVNYCKSTYPNATIYIGMIGFFREVNAVSSRNKILGNVLPAYQECRDFGALYLNDVEYVMHDYSYYNDTVHPTSEGTSALASAIYQSLTTGHVEYNKSQALNFDITGSNVTQANIAWYDVISNKMHTITMNGNFVITPINLAANSDKTFDLGTPNSSFMRLSNTNIILKRYSNLRIVAVDNTSIYRPAILSIDAETGHLKLKIENYGYESKDIASIVITEPIIVPWLLW